MEYLSKIIMIPLHIIVLGAFLWMPLAMDQYGIPNAQPIGIVAGIIFTVGVITLINKLP